MRALALVLRRLVWFPPTLLGLLAVTFVISRVIPADPVALVAGETATPAQVEALRQSSSASTGPCPSSSSTTSTGSCAAISERACTRRAPSPTTSRAAWPPPSS